MKLKTVHEYQNLRQTTLCNINSLLQITLLCMSGKVILTFLFSFLAKIMLKKTTLSRLNTSGIFMWFSPIFFNLSQNCYNQALRCIIYRGFQVAKFMKELLPLVDFFTNASATWSYTVRMWFWLMVFIIPSCLWPL